MTVGAGVINSDFCRNISVIFFNFSNKFYYLQIGDGIAQIVFEKNSRLLVEEVFEFVHSIALSVFKKD